MNTRPPKSSKQKKDFCPEYNRFTDGGNKKADLMIYYNVAFDNLVRFKKQSLYDRFSPEKKLAFLAQYFWKVSRLKKNPNGYELTEVDKEFIPVIEQKLEAIRNYQSHIWHDDQELIFDEKLIDLIQRKYDEAKAQLMEDHPNEAGNFEFQEARYLQRTKQKKSQSILFADNNRITVEGRMFFLSFFLTTGEMNNLLQQASGYKRTDMELFKMKRELYSFYCHRDGASLNDLNHTESVLGQMEQQDRADLLKARTAYKLISYLFDYPDYWGSSEAMPLVVKTMDNDVEKYISVTNVQELQQYIEDNGLFPELDFMLIERKPEKDEVAKKEHEEKYRNGTISFIYTPQPYYTFHIGFDALNRLVLLHLLHVQEMEGQKAGEGEEGDVKTTPYETFIKQLLHQIERRAKLYRLIHDVSAGDRTDEEKEYLLNRENQHLRGGRKLTELGISFFDALERGEKERDNVVTPLTEYLKRNDDEREDDLIHSEPIQMYRQDFVTETEQKYRAGNRFVFYTAKFLMDFAGDGWHWCMEKFEMGKKDPADTESLLKIKKYFKSSEIPDNGDYRLTLENDHIYWGMPGLPVPEDKSWKPYYQFSIGARALRYLAVYIQQHFKEEAPALAGEKISTFLQLLTEDLQTLQHDGGWRADKRYHLLEAHFVQEYLKPNSKSREILKTQLEKRIEHITKEWETALHNITRLSRAEKNKLVMDAYRLYKWPEDPKTKAPKFLRQNEYNQLSVCHYSLHLKGENANPAGKMVKRKNQFAHLFEDLFTLNRRIPPIPQEIVEQLNKADSLDELLKNVIANRQDFLMKNINTDEHRLFEDCRLLGISIPADLQNEAEKTVLKDKHKETLAVQPFAIHPMLVLKYFFPDKYNAGSQAKSTFIFEDVRKNGQLKTVLYQPFHNHEIADSLYVHDHHKKLRHKLKGLINTTLTEDILLWWMAQRYLNNEYTRTMGELLRQTGKDKYTIQNFRSLKVPLPLKKIADENADAYNKDSNNKVLYTSVIMHQLDDIMFFMQEGKLRKAALHLLGRAKNEAGVWEKDFEEGSIPSGAREQPIPFEDLKREIEFVRKIGQRFADHVMNLENTVLETAKRTERNSAKEHQDWLMDYKPKHPIPHLRFPKILEIKNMQQHPLDHKTQKLLEDYRNIAMHNDIPVTKGSFSWITRQNGPLREILKIAEDLHTKKDRDMYQPGGEKHRKEDTKD